MLLIAQSWWNQSTTRVSAIILGVVLISLRIYLTYKNSKDVHRSPRVRRMERNISIALWTFVALAALVLYIASRSQ
jgi:hypothetical protein